jgi:hypothetical protein
MDGYPGARTRLRLWLVVWAIAGAPVASYADQDSVLPGAVAAATPAGRPTVTLTRTAEPPAIDGELEDPVWRTAALIDAFVQERPVEGAPATERTEVRLAFDSANLYVAVTAYYSDARLIRANLRDRDQTEQDDTVAVLFDPFQDQQRAYLFSVNAYGVQRDAIVQDGGSPGGRGRGRGCCGAGAAGRGGGAGGSGGDASWNALYESAARLGESSWSAEMRIPFKSLRYPARSPGESHQWSFQVQRSIQSKNEQVVWAPISRDILGRLGQMGELVGIAAVSLSRNLELQPTFTAAAVGRLDGTSGRFVRERTRPEVGVDLNYGITSNLTANVTVNPEFSQVESDNPQIAVNQRFPLFFEEQRPFFLEGQEIFSVGGPLTLVHTRTIVDPRFGAKLTGTLGRTTFGVVVADDEAPGRTEDPSDPASGRSAQFVIGRARYDLYSQSHVGVLVTDRELAGGFSRLAAFDTVLRLGQSHELTVRSAVTRSREPGGVSVQDGSYWDLRLQRQGRHLAYTAQYFEVDPGFRTDAGFVRRVDLKRTQVRVGYQWRPEGRVVQWGPEFTYARNRDFSGLVVDEQFQLDLSAEFARNVRLNSCLWREMERFEGVNFWKTSWCVGTTVDSNRAVTVSGSIGGGDGIHFVDDPLLGRRFESDLSVTVRPSARLETRLGLTTSRLRRPADGDVLFDAKVLRVRTTYQFTNRLLLRNITQFDSFEKQLGLNLLLTYRVNAGTAFFVGYDDHYQRGDLIEDVPPLGDAYRRTNRAIFTKLQYLFRY